MYSNRKWIFRVMLVGVSVMATVTSASAQAKIHNVDLLSRFAPGLLDQARDLFNAGQELYDEGKFTEAERRFREVIQRFPRNVIADRADYYLIRTLKQLERKTEALSRIDAFGKSYPRSKWLNDVEELRISLTNEVPAQSVRLLQTPFGFAPPAPPAPPAPQGPQVPPVPQNTSPGGRSVIVPRPSQYRPGRIEITDPEVGLQQEIMRAVFMSNADRAIEIATERLKSDPADPVVLSNLYMVADSTSRSTRALPMLLDIAKNSTNMKARKDAIFWISQSKGDREAAVDALVAMLPSIQDDESDTVAFALGQVKSEKALNALATIARDKTKSERARNNAIFWIGQSNNAGRVPILEEIYKNNMDSAKTRTQVAFALSQHPDSRAVAILANMASTDPEIAVRKQAVLWLGQMKSAEAGEALENLLRKK
ncbi:MAG TPA: HEAT repeat domain-containing protein [Terriglobia bacterium]|nr:HEAT repeat domain-containing protein [Terriglobia bacterium]